MNSQDLNDVEEIQAFLNEAVAGGCEGLMIKTLTKWTFVFVFVCLFSQWS
jgi:ATP-dependent DNA ligase